MSETFYDPAVHFMHALRVLIYITYSPNPSPAVSTAPKELREVDMNAKMSKSKKKKLKKRAKRNQQLMDQTMQHIVEVEKNELLEKSGGSDQLEKDAAAEDEEEDEAAADNREKEGVKEETTTTAAINGQNGKEDEEEDNVHDDDTKVDGECFPGHLKSNVNDDDPQLPFSLLQILRRRNRSQMRISRRESRSPT